MTRTPSPARVAALAAAALTLGVLALPAGPAAASAHGRSQRADLVARADGHARFANHGHGGAATFFGTDPGHAAHRPAGVAATDTPAAAARGWMATYGPVFGVADARHDLRVTGASRDVAGSIVRMQQTVDGVPVLGGGFAVALDARNDLMSVNGKVTGLASTAPVAVPRPAARAVAKAAVARSAPGATRLAASRPRLTVLDQSLFGAPPTTGPSTVWSVEVASPDRTVRHQVFVDVVHGAVVLDLDADSYATPQPHRVICRPAAGNDRRINNPRCARPSNNSKVKVIAWESNPPPRSSTDAHNAFRFAGAVWKFYWQLLGRNSLDGHGMALGSTVHFCPPKGSGSCPFDNAFWDGHEMVYGAGYTTALDVVGHEMTHGVTQHTSNLLSYYQSGAINESTSDVMGELIQQIEGPSMNAYDPSKAWRVGEDLPIGAVRWMNNPGHFGDPDRMTSSDYSHYPTYSRGWDNGGVHANAGVGNKTAYLIAAGPQGDGATGSFDGVTMSGVSPRGSERSRVVRDVKTANIYYRLDKTMASATTYADLFTLLPAACDALVPTAGSPHDLPLPGGGSTHVTTADCDQVRLAVQATQLDQAPIYKSARIPVAAVADCSNGGAPTTLRLDRFESNPLAAGSYARGQSTTRDRFGLKAFGSFWWSNTYINYYGSKPPVYQEQGSKASLYGDDADPTWLDPLGTKYDRQDSWVQMVKPIAVDAGTSVVFDHAWEFDYSPYNGAVRNFDGGKVYYSVDGGSYRDVARLPVQNGYNGTIADVSGDRTNPLRGQQAFVASSHGWTATKLDLSSLAGHHVRLRWRIGGDAVVGSLGWYIDNVRAYTCNETTTLSADPMSVPAQDPTTLTAQLIHGGVVSSAADGQSVHFYRRVAGTTTWEEVGSALLSGGTARWPSDTPTAGSGQAEEYQARFSGYGSVPASRSAVVSVQVT